MSLNHQAAVTRLDLTEQKLQAALESVKILKQKAADRALHGSEVAIELSKALQATIFCQGHFSALKREASE